MSGGTFTDLVAVHTGTGAFRVSKVPSTPANQSVGVIDALQAADVSVAEAGAFVHGTSAVLERIPSLMASFSNTTPSLSW